MPIENKKYYYLLLYTIIIKNRINLTAKGKKVLPIILLV